MYRIMLAPMNAHFFIHVHDIQLKVTKSNVLSVDLVTFVAFSKKTRGNSFAFKLNSNQK
jgi:hypothetical protein